MTDRIISNYATLADIPSDLDGVARALDTGLLYVGNGSTLTIAQTPALQLRGNALITTTWANRATAISTIAALTPANGWVFVSDLGIEGALYWCDGTKLIKDSPVVLAENTLTGYILPSLAAANAATYSQTGTLITVTSVGHLIPNNAHNGKDVYLSIGSGAAVTGWFSNFTYVSADSFTCISTVSQSTSGIVNTNTAAITVDALTKTLPGAAMGKKKKLRTSYLLASNNSADTKTFKAFLGASTNYINVPATTVVGNVGSVVVSNRNGNEAIQVFNGGNGGSNTAIDQSLYVTLQLSAANNFMAIEYLVTELF